MSKEIVVQSARSSAIQHLFHEGTYSTKEWDIISNLVFQPQVPTLNEEQEKLIQLDQALRNCLWYLVDTQLSPFQRQVCHLVATAIAQDNTSVQQWVADQMGSSQPNIHKSLNGNTDYTYDPPKRFGGIGQKLSKLIKKDKEIHPIMCSIHSQYDCPSLRLPHYLCFKRIISNGHGQDFASYLATGQVIDRGCKE